MNAQAAIAANLGDPADADATVPGPVQWDSPNGQNPDEDFATLWNRMEQGEKPAEAPKEEPAAPEKEPEAATEPEKEEKPKEEAKEVAVLDLTPFREALPGLVIEKPEDLVSIVTQLRDTKDVYDQMERLVSGDTALQTYLRLRTEGTDASVAVIEAFGDKAQVPDKDEDPEAYANWKAEEARKEEREKAQQREIAKTKQIQERAAREAEQTLKAFTERMKEVEGFDAKSFVRTFNALTMGDELGRFRQDAFDIVYKGLNHDKILAEAVKKAEGAAFARGAKSVKDKAGALPDVPNPSGSRASVSTPESEEIKRFAQELTPSGNWWDNLPK